MCIIEWVESVYSQSIRTGTFLILALIGIVFVLSLLFSKRKKVHLTLLIFMVVFYIFAKVHCGASLKDVSVMKPMAEAISNYIVKNGIPKSLKDIPDLPYELEGKCEMKHIFLNGYTEVNNKANADWQTFTYNCKYKKKYNIYLYFRKSINKNNLDGSIKISVGSTIVGLAIETNSNGKLYKSSDIGIKTIHYSGFCSQLRQ